jgi:hypothetical protein
MSELDPLLDLTIANAGLVMDLRREVRALRSTLAEIHPAFAKSFRNHFADSDERGEELYETVRANSQKVARYRDSLRNTDKQVQP